jgi:hypothetical protein
VTCTGHCFPQSKWTEFFPGIVSKARTIDVLVNGMAGRSESLVLVNNNKARSIYLSLICLSVTSHGSSLLPRFHE